MTRFLTCGTLAACVLVVLGAAAQQPVFRGAGDAVRVFVTVTDRDGRLVTTLPVFLLFLPIQGWISPGRIAGAVK